MVGWFYYMSCRAGLEMANVGLLFHFFIADMSGMGYIWV